eukprot:1156274-Pelagomonas_calceolata.AAC.3
MNRWGITHEGQAASYFFITSHTAEYPMLGDCRWSIWVSRIRIDQDSIEATGGVSSLIRNAGVKENTLQSNCTRREHVSHPGLQHTHTDHKYSNHPAIYRTRPSSSGHEA